MMNYISSHVWPSTTLDAQDEMTYLSALSSFGNMILVDSHA